MLEYFLLFIKVLWLLLVKEDVLKRVNVGYFWKAQIVRICFYSSHAVWRQ